MDFHSAWARLPCWLSKSPFKQHFLDIYLLTFMESVISKIQKAMRVIFLSKYLKFNLDFRNEAKKKDEVRKSFLFLR